MRGPTGPHAKLIRSSPILRNCVREDVPPPPSHLRPESKAFCNDVLSEHGSKRINFRHCKPRSKGRKEQAPIAVASARGSRCCEVNRNRPASVQRYCRRETRRRVLLLNRTTAISATNAIRKAKPPAVSRRGLLTRHP